tara:strand:+ start:2075 stop:2818 length:744 start_codon:yes stop_codon:yes gene_type:complete
MGTAKGNYGRKMYSDPEYKRKMSIATTFDRVEVVKYCKNCGREFTVIRTVKNGIQHVSRKERKSCSSFCAHSRIVTEETKRRISKNANPWNKNKRYKTGENVKKRKKKDCYCDNCGKELKRKGKTGLCIRCYISKKRKNIDKLSIYRRLCNFDFGLSNFSDEFDFFLIEEHGWYKSKNQGDNLTGVSRDHIVSVKYGFEHGILPYIMKHPANCQLLQHNKNSSKYDKCDLTIEELLDKIKMWNEKYD